MDRFRHDHLNSDFSLTHGETRLKQDLADAMRESPSGSSIQKEGKFHCCSLPCLQLRLFSILYFIL